MQSQSSKLLSAMREEIRAREIELVSATNGELLTAKAARLSRPQILLKEAIPLRRATSFASSGRTESHQSATFCLIRRQHPVELSTSEAALGNKCASNPS
jgi:hypothetical protein